MGRRYVRDKAGRFAAKGGGSKGKGGKMGKSAKNVKARAAYKKASGKLREQKKFDKQMKAGSKSSQKYWKKQLGGAKSGMTRVSNRLAGKGKGAAATKAVGTGPKQARGVKKRRGAKVYDNTTNTSIKMKTVKKNLRRKYPESKAAKSLEKRVATKTAKKAPRKQKGAMAYDGPNKARSQAADRVIAKTKAKRAAKKPSYKKPKPGETAKQYKARLKRSGTLSTRRALSGNFGTRSEYYSIPGTKTGGKQTRKSINRAKNRDFYSEGSNKRSRAITKSKQRNKAKVKKQLDAIRRKAKNIKFGEKKGPLTSGLTLGSSFFSSKWK